MDNIRRVDEFQRAENVIQYCNYMLLVQNCSIFYWLQNFFHIWFNIVNHEENAIEVLLVFIIAILLGYIRATFGVLETVWWECYYIMYMRRKNIMLHFSQLSQDTDFSNYLFEVVGVFKNVLNKLYRKDLPVLFFSGLDDFAEGSFAKNA